jgi:3-mercaptopyruvate sulfurtransferase SseA
MRTSIWLLLAIIVTTVVALACNSNETLLTPQSPQAASKAATPTPPPPDNARRITAEELHKLWEKNEVTIIDTRAEPAYKQEHIRGAILVPAGTVLAKLDQLPKDKMIVAYCT